MASSRELEHQAEADRNQIAETLNRLRERMSPGQLVDQAIEYARSNGGVDFARNLGDQAKANPIPVIMVAAGLGWLMFGRPAARRAYAPSIVPDDEFEAQRRSLDERFDELARDHTAEVAGATRTGIMDTAAERTRHARDRAREAGDYARESAEEAAGHARDKISSAYHTAERAGSRARDVVSSAYDTAAGAASGAVSSAYSATAGAVGRSTDAVRGGAASMGRRAHNAGEFASEVGRSTARGARYAGRSVAEQAGRAQSTIAWLAREQPLVLGAIGLAIGALVGAGLPRTQREDEVMGETSDQFKSSAREQAREHFAQAREAGGQVADKVRGEAEHQGFTTESAQEVIRDIGEKVSAVAAAAREGTEDELKSAKEKVDEGSEKYEKFEEHASHEGPAKTQAHKAAGVERYSEADPHYVPEDSGQPAGQDIKTTERVG